MKKIISFILFLCWTAFAHGQSIAYNAPQFTERYNKMFTKDSTQQQWTDNGDREAVVIFNHGKDGDVIVTLGNGTKLVYKRLNLKVEHLTYANGVPYQSIAVVDDSGNALFIDYSNSGVIIIYDNGGAYWFSK